MKPSELASALEVLFAQREPVLVKGSPGIGKTDILTEAANRLNMDLIVSHPVVSDPVDFKGLPFVVDGGAEFLPIGDLALLLNAKKPTVFFMDDLGQAPAAVQAAAMQLILARRINGHKVSEHVVFAAATNKKTDKAGVSGILEPVKSRFATIIELEVDVSDWCRWARKNKLPEEVIMFIQNVKPNLLHDFKPSADITNSPCPRTVTNASRLLHVDLPRSIRKEMVTGACGEGFAHELFAFIDMMDQWPDIDAALKAPETFKMPENISVLYALCAVLTQRMTPKNADSVLRLVNRMPIEFQVCVVKAASDRDPEIERTQAFSKWCIKNADQLV